VLSAIDQFQRDSSSSTYAPPPPIAQRQ
jgi:hypothetical protein